MHTVLTLAPDVAERIQHEAEKTGEPFESVGDRLLRSGLQREGAPVTAKPFVIRSKKLGIPLEWTSGKVEDLLDLLEGPDRR